MASSQINATSERSNDNCRRVEETKGGMDNLEVLEAEATTVSTSSASSTTTTEETSIREDHTVAGSSSTSPEPLDNNNPILPRLARQLEYYFSHQNLSKDTYLQTLRNLNDGCVPATILANFTKVRHVFLYERDATDARRVQSLLKAAASHSVHLCVVAIDKRTGKRLTSTDDSEQEETSSSSWTIMAVGTVDNEPLSAEVLQSSSLAASEPRQQQQQPPVQTQGSPTSSSGTATDTILMRDVLPEVTEADIRSLLASMQDCPPIRSVTPDVASCWYVRFDTTDRSDLMRIMMTLRTQTLAGCPIHARVKATATAAVADAATPFLPPPLPVVAPLTANQSQNKKSKTRRRNNNSNKNQNNRKKKNSSDETPAPPQAVKKKSSPPTMSADNFPSLLGADQNKVEWETPLTSIGAGKAERKNGSGYGEDDDGEEPKLAAKEVSPSHASDGASTAASTSSSVDSFPKRGYAAALMTSNKKMDAPTRSPTKKVSSSQPAAVGAKSAPRPSDKVNAATPSATKEAAPVGAAAAPPKAEVVVHPPVWGKGRSFAEILRESDKAAAAATS